MKGYLLAAGVGYIIGVLWAPRKGSVLRAELAQRLDEVRSTLAERGEAFRNDASDRVARASESVRKAKETASEAIEKLEHDVHNIADKSRNILAPEG